LQEIYVRGEIDTEKKHRFGIAYEAIRRSRKVTPSFRHASVRSTNCRANSPVSNIRK